MRKKKFCFDMDEYHRVNDELLERMRSVFSHGFSLVSMVGILWTFTATLMSNFSQNISSQENRFVHCVAFSLIIVTFTWNLKQPKHQ